MRHTSMLVHIFILASFLCACASTDSIGLSPENRVKLGRIDVVVVVAQDEIYAESLKPLAPPKIVSRRVVYEP